MKYVYVLQALRDRRMLYFGVTSDLRQRLKAHRDGLSRTTRRYLPMRLVYYEAFQDDQDAEEREVALKRFGSSYRSLLKRIRRSRPVVLTHGGAG
ncbi:MAG: GIY-YIG nuclease family protein [Candidatus Omnitrophica bacterium]|nr:GIY-YIG nuclease family protein [Candidatus Omnitrophota bacterium]